jgi:hypothetical protein
LISLEIENVGLRLIDRLSPAMRPILALRVPMKLKIDAKRARLSRT